MRARIVTAAKVFLYLALVALASCSKLSDVGKQDEPVPQAIATSIGDEFQSDSNGNLTMTVRAGADVVISGKESRKGADDTGVPLIAFDWKQDSGDAYQVHLVKRTQNTFSFTAPQVIADNTELHFTLTVNDAKGTADTARATVRVRNFRDPDHFLQYLNADTTIPVTVATASPIQEVSSAGATEELPVTVTMTKLLTFVDRNGILQTAKQVGDPVTISTGWSRKLGSSDQCLPTQDVSANKNPTIKFAIPRLNLDDKLGDSISGFPDALVLSDVMEASDISDPAVKLEVRFDASSTAGIPTLCIGQNNTVAEASGAVWDTETLLQEVSPRDSRQSAEAYYAAINPTGEVQKTTLNIWLTENGFTPSVTGWNADAHAVYTNNYDLGFGRDMYMKFGACDVGIDATKTLQERMGNCDVAAVVMNYPNVEAAAKKLNVFAAVAMEYSRLHKSDVIGDRFVKFYTFTPDTRTGEFKRVLSLNFDRRGEQYMPQACVVCHGGVPQALDDAGAYPAKGNVNAAFLPWDLDSFLFTNTDPGFSTKPSDADLKARYSRDNQLAQFKRLNEGAYLTYADPSANPGPANPGRFALARELTEGWYGGANLPSASFGGSFVPDGWKSANNNNPTDSATIYTDVFARDCRMCHSMHVPNGVDPRLATITPNGATTPIAACSSDSQLVGSSVGAGNQVPMGCYWQFAHAPNLADRLSRGQMPVARRTMDRLWVGSGGIAGVGSQLATHLGKQLTELAPGTPTAITVLTQSNPISNCVDSTFTKQSATAYTARRNYWVSADGSTSNFPAMYANTLTTPQGSASSLVGAEGPLSRFKPDVPGSYLLTLDVGGAVNASATVVVNNCAPTVPTVASYGTTRNSLLSVSDPANGLLRDAVDLDGDSVTAALDSTDATCSPVYESSLTVATDGTFSYKHDGTLPFTAGEQDHFKVKISDQYGGVSSTCVTVTINDATDIEPPAPAPVLAVTPRQGGSGQKPYVDLSWTASQDEDDNGNPKPLAGYEVYRCNYDVLARSCASPFEIVPGGVVTATTFADLNAPSNKLVRYMVAAVDTGSNPANGNAPNRTYSTPVNATTYVSFANDVYSQLSGCSSCHVLNGSASSYWQHNSSATDTWSSLNQWTTKTYSGSTTSMPNQAALYTNPCNSTQSHNVASKMLNSTQCTALLQWITEGHVSN